MSNYADSLFDLMRACIQFHRAYSPSKQVTVMIANKYYQRNGISAGGNSAKRQQSFHQPKEKKKLDIIPGTLQATEDPLCTDN